MEKVPSRYEVWVFYDDPSQENPMINFYCEDVSEYIPLIKEEMKKECENEK